MNDSNESTSLIDKPQEASSGVTSAKFLLAVIGFVCFTSAGMNSILAVYFNSVLGMSQSISGLLTNLAFFLTYGIAIVGGVLSDSFLGHYKTMLTGLSVTACGMGLFIVSELGIHKGSNLIHVLGFLACFVFVSGGGVMKPSTSAFLGDQFRPHEDTVRSVYFSWYYLVIQIGAIASSIGIPFLFEYEPAWITFVVLTVPSLLAIPLFVLPNQRYTKNQPKGNMLLVFLKVVKKGMTEARATNDTHWLDKTKRFYPADTVEDVKKSLGVLKIFALLPFFWGIFFQMYSMWVFLASSMNRKVTIDHWTFEIPASETLSLNPLLDCVLIPLFAKVVYPVFVKIGLPLTSLKRIGLGILCTSAALIVAGFVQMEIDSQAPHSVSIAWIIPQYFFVSCGEVLLSVTAYEFAYTQAPKTMKGFLTALWLATIAIGNVLVIVVQLIPLQAALMYFVMAGIILLVFFAFLFIARSYSYAKEDEGSINSD